MGYNSRVGWQGKVYDGLTLGASYQSRTYMTKLDKYAGLFAEQGDFDIPSTFIAGAAYKVTPKLTFALDYQFINYNEVRAVANNANYPLTGLPTSRRLGADDGIGFGWEDMSIVKLGVQYQANDQLTLRGGFSHSTAQTFDNSEIMFNILAPGVIRNHATVGISYKIAENMLINATYARAFSDSITGRDKNAATDVELRMDQHEASIGFTYTW